MAKYTEELGKQIADAIEQDGYTLGEICTIHHISRKTFYQWARKYSEIYLTGKTVTMKEYSADEKTLKMAMDKEGVIEEKVENMPRPWEIIVQNQEAADQIELLRFPGTEDEMEERRKELKQKYASKETEPAIDAYDPAFEK